MSKCSPQKKRKRKKKDDPGPLIESKRTKNEKNDIFDELAKPENFEACVALLNILVTQN